MEKALSWIVYAAGFLILLWGSIEDIRNRTVTSFYIKASYGLSLLVFLSFRMQEWKASVIGLGIGILCMLLAELTAEKIGCGDAYVIGCLGILLGYQQCLSICLIALSFSFPVSGYLFLVRKSSFHKEIPFIPFLLLGYMVICILERIQK